MPSIRELVESTKNTEDILYNITEATNRRDIVIWFATQIRKTNRLNDIEGAAQELASSLYRKEHKWSNMIEGYNWNRFVQSIKKYLKQRGDL